MAQEVQKNKQAPRGVLLGQFLSAKRLEDQGVQQPGAGAQASQGRFFNLQSITSQVDTARERVRTSSGWQPGFVMARFQARQAERLQAVSTQRNTLMAVNSEPEEKKTADPPPPASKPTFRCPWENCDFESEGAAAFQAHILEQHARFHPKSY
jgi:hypothetical protein